MIAPPLLLHSSACLKYKTTAFLKKKKKNNNKSSKEQMDLARNRICYLGLFRKGTLQSWEIGHPSDGLLEVCMLYVHACVHLVSQNVHK